MENPAPKAKKDIRTNSLSGARTRFTSKKKLELIRKKSVPPSIPNKQVPGKRPLPSDINGVARAVFWLTSKAIQTESVEALMLLFSKIIRKGPTVYYCDYVTNVTYKYNTSTQTVNFLRCVKEN